MLNGTSARIICYRQSSFVSSLLLSDMDGTIPPAQGAPAFFATFGPNSLRLWKFQVDCAQPSNFRFTGPAILPLPSFATQCFSPCVGQPGTRQWLDALGDRPMYRLVSASSATDTNRSTSIIRSQQACAGMKFKIRTAQRRFFSKGRLQRMQTAAGWAASPPPARRSRHRSLGGEPVASRSPRHPATRLKPLATATS
jgi:hypothetical protein